MCTDERLRKLLQASPNMLAEVDRILEGRTAAKTEITTGPLLMGMGEGARFLGVGRATLWRMIRARRLEKVEVLPNSFRVRRADLVAIAAERKQDDT